MESKGLNKHMLKHSDSRPFPCSDCSSRFKSRDALKYHALIHVKNQIAAFKCDLCDYITIIEESFACSFTGNSVCLWHMR